MIVSINHKTQAPETYRTARVQSMFNAETADFNREFNLPIEDQSWQVGLIVGASGSGKSSLSDRVFNGRCSPRCPTFDWPNLPIIDAIGTAKTFEEVSSAFVSVGLGNVPAWLRPYHVLSTGEKFRANLARTILESDDKTVIDEFTSVVDRQIAKIGSAAFEKAWRKTGKQAVIVSCHYDIIDYLQPDWVFDTSKNTFQWRSRRQRPRIKLDIYRTNWRYWPLFEDHHYLKLPHMIAAQCYVACVNGEPIAHLAVTTKTAGRNGFEARMARIVVLPDWQGIGIGTTFLSAVCDIMLNGGTGSVWESLPLSTTFSTAHPGLASATRRNPKFTQIAASLHGSNKARSASDSKMKTGYGGHFRATQSFRYIGGRAVQKNTKFSLL